ncbi:alpha-amylase family glycosyl hydrolase [Photobacterium sagamiensis]|uniref:alpha-amylase family glycosyl hydrolase n=1 Tax=Photobacterium sagamiensis TaxID=2910241 RepID=UPI003D0A83A4
MNLTKLGIALTALTALGLLAGCGSGGSSSQQLSDQAGNVSTYACYGGENPACNLRMYQIMVESFVDGDNTADYNQGYGSSHHRGDLKGIIDSLDYIKSLNVNALWLTPVFDSCEGAGGEVKLDATGYYACDYFNVDPNFGTNEQLKTLITQAHEKGMYVFLDGVFGHTNKTGAKPSPTGKLPKLRAGDANYPGMLVDYPSSESLAFFKEVATYWIEEYDIDGWRLDQAYQVPLAEWREIRSAVEAVSAENQQAGKQWGTLGYMVGEVWNSAEYIAETNYGTDKEPGLSSAFNFPLRYGLVQALAVEESGASGDARAINTFWNRIENYPYHAMPNLMLGNHDLVRFGDLIQRGNKGDYVKRHKAAFSFLAAWSGPITFYYGEEIGDEVANFDTKVTAGCVDQGLCDDHVARSSGKVEGVTGVTLTDDQADIKKWLSNAMAVRAAHPALYKGKRRNLKTTAQLYADLKQYGDEQIVYLLNVSTAEQSFELDMSKVKTATKLVDLLTGEEIIAGEQLTTVRAPALTGRLLRIE